MAKDSAIVVVPFSELAAGRISVNWRLDRTAKGLSSLPFANRFKSSAILPMNPERAAGILPAERTNLPTRRRQHVDLRFMVPMRVAGKVEAAHETEAGAPMLWFKSARRAQNSGKSLFRIGKLPLERMKQKRKIPDMTSTVTANGHTVVPKKLRDRFKIKSGTTLDWHDEGTSMRVMKRTPETKGAFLRALRRLGRVPAAPRNRRPVEYD